MSQRKSQSGSTVIVVLLVIVMLAAIGFGGYYVWHRQHDKPVARAITQSITTTKTEATTQTTTPSADPYQGWATFTSKLEKISIKYPADWTVNDDGSESSILNNTAQEENFNVQSPTETLASGTTIFASISFSVATSGETAGDCHGLPIFATKDITVDGRTLTIVTLNSYTNQTDPIGIYVTDEKGLQPGGASSICEPSFTSKYGNSNVFVNASFVLPPTPGDHDSGTDTTLTPAEYNESSLIQQELKSLESLSY